MITYETERDVIHFTLFFIVLLNLMTWLVDWRQCGNSLALCYFAVVMDRLTCAWQYFGTLIFEIFFEIIRFYVDNINFLFLC